MREQRTDFTAAATRGGARRGRPLVLTLLLSASAALASLAVAETVTAKTERSRAPTLAPLIVDSLLVSPAPIRLRGANPHQQVLVTGVTADDRRVDLTQAVELICNDVAVAQVNSSRLEGVAAGKTRLIVRYGDLQQQVEVLVTEFDAYPPVHFGNDVLPLLSKSGCNSGGCHGKASGQNGFKLSVFGFDVVSDYDAIVRDSRGRRVSAASPSMSLLLRKATAAVPHGGGQRIDTATHDYNVLLQWMRQGVPYGAEGAPYLVDIEVEPAERVLTFQSQQQILATATYSDGSTRDITSTAIYSSNTDTIADVDESGLITSGFQPGEAAITVTYMGKVAAVLAHVPRPDKPTPYPDIPVANEIDRFVWAKLERMGILPSELIDDTAFLRRAHLDVIGTLPTPVEVRSFLADENANKRTVVIDRLLERDEFAKYWALKWADILLVDSMKLGPRGAYEFQRWLRRQFSQNRPYNAWARELVTATGNAGRNGPVNFYRATPTPEDAAKAVSQAFLGVRLECAQCHNHPFERWSRSDFYSLVGFFNGMERKPGRDGRDLIYHSGYRKTSIPYTDRVVDARPLGENPPAGLEKGDPRVPLADWLTAPENPWFAPLLVNRVWKHFLGRGFVEPEDDLRSTNPPTNRQLLDYLSDSFVQSGYDIKALIRKITGSRVYQLSSASNDTNHDDEQNFSHYYVKRLSAEVLLDAISAVTEVVEPFPGRPAGSRAIDLWDNRMPSYFLDIFGRPARESPCECGRSSDPTMAQALHLMNAPEIEAKIAHPTGRVARLLKENASVEKIVEELCLAALGRFPSAKEQRVATSLFAAAPQTEAAEDFMWTLLNSYEFLFVR